MNLIKIVAYQGNWKISIYIAGRDLYLDLIYQIE